MAYVRSGLRSQILREFGLGGTAVAGIGFGTNTTAVTVDTRFINGAAAGLNGAVAGQNVAIKAFSPAATIVADGAGVSPVVTGGATFTNADFFNATFFNAQKMALVLAVPASNANEVDGNLASVIGGTGGAGVYARTFALDLSGAGTATVIAQIAVTPAAA
jgi:hypothetical protein